MANTTNLDLVKPAGTDQALISVLNGNSDKIDQFAGDTNTSLVSLADGMAIVANGDVHGAISSGQYVYVRNHTTLAEGLYTATSSIAANASLSTSNLTADSDGGFNSLSQAIANKINTSDIANNLTTTASGKVLDARKGKALNDAISTNVIATGTLASVETALVSLIGSMSTDQIVKVRFGINPGSGIFATSSYYGTLIKYGANILCVSASNMNGTRYEGTYNSGTWSWQQLATAYKLTQVKSVAFNYQSSYRYTSTLSGEIAIACLNADYVLYGGEGNWYKIGTVGGSLITTSPMTLTCAVIKA